MITNVHGDASHAKERLFICQRAASQKAAADLEEEPDEEAVVLTADA